MNNFVAQAVKGGWNFEIAVICLKTGDKYPDLYVTRLRNMVERHLTLPHKFICYTDKPVEGIECYPPPRDLPGWWGKIGLFKPELEGIGENSRVLYFDLDMIVVDNINELALFPGRFSTIKHWKKRLKRSDTILNYNTSCMVFERPGTLWGVDVMLHGVEPVPGLRHGWTVLHGQKRVQLRGDQDWLAYLFPDEAVFPSGWFVAFEDCPKAGPPKGCKVVVCNKHDNHTVTNVAWVKQAWR